jgi:hypothetical protein
MYLFQKGKAKLTTSFVVVLTAYTEAVKPRLYISSVPQAHYRAGENTHINSRSSRVSLQNFVVEEVIGRHSHTVIVSV